MTGLVHELQRDAMDSSVSVTDLLRKALVVARKLSVVDIQDWISKELSGYGNSDKIPSYRVTHGEIKAWNPYNGLIPIIIQYHKMAEQLRERAIGQPIGEMESLINNPSKSSEFQVNFPAKIENELMAGMSVPLPPTLHVSHSEIHGVLDAVRNTILEWALKLEEEGIVGEGLSFSKEEKIKAGSNIDIRIENFQGILGDVKDSHVHQRLIVAIKPNDFKGLSKYLESIGIEKEDILELEKVISDDPIPNSNKNFGKNISNWIGKMISKSATGSWNVSVGAAGGLLANALSKYFGL